MLLLVFSRKDFITTIFVKTFHTPLLSNIVAIIIATGQYKCHYIFFSTPSTLENIQYYTNEVCRQMGFPRNETQYEALVRMQQGKLRSQASRKISMQPGFVEMESVDGMDGWMVPRCPLSCYLAGLWVVQCSMYIYSILRSIQFCEKEKLKPKPIGFCQFS